MRCISLRFERCQKSFHMFTFHHQSSTITWFLGDSVTQRVCFLLLSLNPFILISFAFLVLISLREPGRSPCIPTVLNSLFYGGRPGGSPEVVSLSAFLVRRISSANLETRAQFSCLSSITWTMLLGEMRRTAFYNNRQSVEQLSKSKNVCSTSTFSASQYRQVELLTFLILKKYDRKYPCPERTCVR